MMSSIFQKSSSNTSHKHYENELPEKDLENLKVEYSKKEDFAPKFREYNFTSYNNSLKCPNNFSYSNMNSDSAYSTNIQSQFSIQAKNNTNLNQATCPITNSISSNNFTSHSHDLPVIHAYSNNVTNLMSKNYSDCSTNLKSNSINVQIDRKFNNSHQADRINTYSNSSGIDINYINNSNEQNINHLLIKRDTEIER